MNTFRSPLVLMTLVAVALAAGCQSTPSPTAQPAPPSSSPPQGPSVRTVQANGDIVITTSQRVAMTGLRTASCTAKDPAEVSPLPSRTYYYAYSFMLVDGTVRLHRDGTLTLDDGELYISSELRDDEGAPADPDCPCQPTKASPHPLIYYYFPIAKSKSVQCGSVSTRYVLSCERSGPVEVALRSAGSVWLAVDGGSGCSSTVLYRVKDMTTHARSVGNGAGTSITGVSTDIFKQLRLQKLDAWAQQMGVY